MPAFGMQGFDILDLFIGGILVVMIIGILIGKGQDVISFFNGRSWNENPNRPKYDPKKEEKGILIFCIIELGCILIFHFVAPLWMPAIFIAIGITIASIVWIIWYLRKITIK